MVEEVNTGGLVKFGYSGKTAGLDDERKRDIEEGYRQAEERKRKQRIRNMIVVGIVLVVIILVAIWFLK